MKKRVLIFVLLIFFYVSIGSQFSFAQTADQNSTKSAAVEITYTLPYPGVLPDNPLYFLKATRDRLVSLLINDPVKKAEFNLLTSDKRTAASQILASSGKEKLAIDTFSKGNNYLEDSIENVKQAKRAGNNVDTVLSNLKTAIGKHKEVVKTVEKEVGKAFKEQARYEEKRLINLEKMAKAI